MSTRSLIGICDKEGHCKAIYCHWDGYIEYNGVVLNEFYNTAEKVEELLALGNISSLGEKPNPDPTCVHNFDTPQKGVTVAYHRDRGEELQPATEYETFSALEKDGETSWAEFLYVFDMNTGMWLVKYATPDKKWAFLADEIEAIQKKKEKKA